MILLSVSYISIYINIILLAYRNLQKKFKKHLNKNEKNIKICRLI